MFTLVNRLEQILWVWEMVCQSNNVNWHYNQLIKHPNSYDCAGALLHWQDFRKYLLSLEALKQVEFAADRFNLPQEIAKTCPILSSVPARLTQWTVSSRRIFYVDRQLAALLRSTTLNNLVWKDMPFPFLSFGIALEQPITSYDGTKYDFLLVEQLRNGLKVLLLPEALDTRSTPTQLQRDHLLEDLRRQDVQKIHDRLIEWNHKYKLPALSEVYVSDQSENTLVVESLRKLQAMPISSMDSGKQKIVHVSGEAREIVFQIVLGLCMYIHTLPSQSRHISEWGPAFSRAERKTHPRAVVNGAQVCTVGSKIYMTGEQLELIESLGREAFAGLSPHFVRGHYRRPSGLGHDPNAKKSVQVDTYFVGRDQLAEGTLAVGAITIFK